MTDMLYSKHIFMFPFNWDYVKKNRLKKGKIKVSTDIKKFISDVLPPQYISGNKISKYGRLLDDDEYTTPQKLLETNKYFDEFRF